MHVLIHLQNSDWFTKKDNFNVNFNLNQMNSWCIKYNQYIQNKIKNKLCMKAINYVCFKSEEKTTRKVKKDKNYQLPYDFLFT